MATLDEIKRDLEREITVPLWPHAGRIFGLSRASAYAAASSGDIPTVRIGRLFRVPTGPLRALIGMAPSASETTKAA